MLWAFFIDKTAFYGCPLGTSVANLALPSEILNAEFCWIVDKFERGSSLCRFRGSKELFESSVLTVIKETAVTLPH